MSLKNFYIQDLAIMNKAAMKPLAFIFLETDVPCLSTFLLECLSLSY